MGTKAVAAFDLSASCSGFLYGLSMADAMIRVGQFQSALVIGAEIKSRTLDPHDKETAVLFGDGAGAALLVREESSGPLAPGILGIRLYAQGAGHDLIKVKAGDRADPAGQKRSRQMSTCCGCRVGRSFGPRFAIWKRP
ncbi:MAG: hypothetical protein U0361_17020 [Nitrospiraceae bacterium]